MMKKITLLFSMLLVTFSYSQDLLQDFETPGAIDGGFGAGVSTAELADPAAGGTNGTVAQIIAGAAGDIWQGANITLNQDVDLTQTLPADRKMEIDVYSDSPTPISMLVRVTGPVNNEASAVVTHPGGSVWATLTATFDTSWEGKPVADGIYTGFVVFPNWDTGTANFINPAIARTVYFDNIKGLASTAETCTDGMMNNMETGVDCGGPNCAACPNPPSAAPTTPPNRAPADVVSIYSDAYTDEASSNVETFGGAVLSEIDLSGNSVRSVTTPVSGAGFQTQFFNPTPNLDLSGMTDMHIDFYFEGSAPTAGTVFIVNTQHLDGTNIEQFFDVTALASSTWHEMDIPFTSFTNPTKPRDQIGQVIVNVAGPDGALVGPIYIDNLYFHNNMVLGTEDFNKALFSVYPNPSQSSWTVKTEDVNMSSIQVFDILGKNVLSLSPNKAETVIDGSSLKAGLYFAQIKTATGINSIKLIKN